MPKRKTQARTAPPPAYHGMLRGVELDAVHDPDPVALAVVAIVSVAVPAATPVMLTGVVAPNVKVGASTALFGLEVNAAVSATLPVKPPAGVMVMVEVFPVVAPAVTVTPVPAIAKLGGVTAVSPTVLETLAL